MVPILNWLRNNSLIVNYDKSFFLPFSGYKNSLPPIKEIHIKLQENNIIKIVKVDHVKYLGVEIDCRLRWDVHIN